MDERERQRFEVFLGSVALHSVLGTCDRLRTACGIVKHKRLRSIGYNGAVSGDPHCDEDGHLLLDGHCVRTIHGEENAILNASREHLQDAEAVIITQPCIDCLKRLIAVGVRRIYYIGDYPNTKGKELIQEIADRQGVELIGLSIDWQELFQNFFDLFARQGGILERTGYRLKVIKESLQAVESVLQDSFGQF